MKSICWYLAPLVGLSFVALAFAADDKAKPDVLFIAVDDLNDWVGCLGGHPQARTPNIDRLAARGVTFTHAYCASPVCNPSRAALMSGLRSSTSGVYSNNIDWRPTRAGQVTTLNQHFRDSGYHTVGAGKIYHEAYSRHADWDDYARLKHGDVSPPDGASTGVGGIKFAPVDAADEDLADYEIVNYCIRQLQRPHDKPLFLACGLHKPHMPWYVPRKYYDLFPLDSIQLPKVQENDLADVPAAGVKMAAPQGDHAKMLASGRWKEAVQGYLAAGAYCDAQIGRLLAGLDASPYKDKMIIVFWGDHGWHLGQKEHWRKFALWEEATHAPLICVAPGITTAGTRCDRTVDFMSIYPTLCELCGLETPSHVQGISVLPLLKNPQAAWDRPVLTTHGYMNHAVRSDKWRYIRYADGGEELYDEQADPLEWKNLAGDSQLAEVKQQLAQWMPAENVASPDESEQKAAKAQVKKLKKAQKK